MKMFKQHLIYDFKNIILCSFIINPFVCASFTKKNVSPRSSVKMIESKPISLDVSSSRTLKPDSPPLNELALINAAKHFKLTMHFLKARVTLRSNDENSERIQFFLTALQTMPIDIFVDGLNKGRKKDEYFAKLFAERKYKREELEPTFKIFEQILKDTQFDESGRFFDQTYHAWVRNTKQADIVKLFTTENVSTVEELLTKI